MITASQLEELVHTQKETFLAKDPEYPGRSPLNGW